MGWMDTTPDMDYWNIWEFIILDYCPFERTLSRGHSQPPPSATSSKKLRNSFYYKYNFLFTHIEMLKQFYFKQFSLAKVQSLVLFDL